MTDRLHTHDRAQGCECELVHSDVIAAARQVQPADDELYDLADFFKVLGDSTRVRIMWALDAGEMCVCDLAELLGMTKSAVSHQLGSLRHSNLVKFRRDGKQVFYTLADEHVRRIFEMALEHIRE
jgi:ArsR family transcriptional regulator